MTVKNVLVISNSASVMGGAEKIACQTAELCATRGLNVHLFAGSGPISPSLESCGVHVHCLQQHYISSGEQKKAAAALQGLWNEKAMQELKNLLSSLDPTSTVVNLHSWTHTLSPSILDAIRVKKFPLVINAHDYFLSCPNGGFFDFVRKEPCSLRTVGKGCRKCNCDKRNWLQKKYRLLRFRIQTHLLKKMNPSVVFVSDFSKSILSGSIPFKYVGYRISNPVDEKLGASQLSYDERDIDCLYVGRVEPEKGCELFCEALNGHDVRAVVVGDGCERLGLEQRYPNVEFVGRVDENEVVDYYRRARVLVFPSLVYETQGLSAIEARRYGSLPVVVSSGVAASECVTDGVDGCLFNPGDARSLNRAVMFTLRREVNDRMRDAVASGDYAPFNSETYIDNMLEVFSETIDRWELHS